MPDLQSGRCRFESRPGLFAPRSTQPSIPPGSVNEYQLRLGRQRQVWLIPLADETQGVQVKLCYPLTMRAIPERLRDASCGGAVQIDDLYLFTFFQILQVTLKYLEKSGNLMRTGRWPRCMVSAGGMPVHGKESYIYVVVQTGRNIIDTNRPVTPFSMSSRLVATL